MKLFYNNLERLSSLKQRRLLNMVSMRYWSRRVGLPSSYVPWLYLKMCLLNASVENLMMYAKSTTYVQWGLNCRAREPMEHLEISCVFLCPLSCPPHTIGGYIILLEQTIAIWKDGEMQIV